MKNSFRKLNPMGRISNPTSDLELNTWVEQTIQSEIVRGFYLQEQKSLYPDRSKAAHIKSPKLAKVGSNDRRRSALTKRNDKRRSMSPIAKRTRMSASTSRDDSYSSWRPRTGRPACSMRISELAVPTKRQCLAAWRANANVLPDNMVNRLKMRVMDQEPIVKVSDAINCLKREKRTSDTRNKVLITQNKRPSRKINKEAMENRALIQNQAISDVFGMKIAQLLMRPMDIVLNSQLKNLSNIINEEIHNIIKDKKPFKTNNARNKRMIQEISEKVTIWIGKILQDSTEKLLEEELRVLKRNNVIEITTTGDLITLIEILTQETDLEEQEGPVLDILDDIMDNILHKCVKTPSHSVTTPQALSTSSGENSTDDPDLALAYDEEALQRDVIMDEEDLQNVESTTTGAIVAEEDTIVNDIKNQLNTIIDSLSQEDFSERSSAKFDGQLPYQSNYEDKHDEPNIDVIYSKDAQFVLPEDKNDDVQNKTVHEDLSESPENINISAEVNIENNSMPSPSELSIKKHDKDDESLKANLSTTADEIIIIDDTNPTDNNEEQTSNVSDAIEIISEESEEKNKKVKFSKENLDPMKEKEQYYSVNRDYLQSDFEHLLENIDFAPPNENLLSDADESWPDNPPVTKPSASVTRSITSMGRILESDEKYSNAFEEDDDDDDDDEYAPEKTNSLHGLKITHEGSDDNKNDEQRSVDDSQRKPEYYLPTGEIVSREPDEEHNLKNENDTLLPLMESEIENANILLKDDSDDSQNVLVEPEIINPPEPPFAAILSKWQKYDNNVSLGKLDISKYDRSKSTEHTDEGPVGDLIDQRRCSADEIPSKKFDYRVHQKTAPDWIRRGQGDPSETPCACNPFHYSDTKKMQEREREIRRWCRDLDYILMKLEKWKKWLNYISKYITTLKHKAGIAPRNTDALAMYNDSKIAGIGQNKLLAAGTDKDKWRKLNKRANGNLDCRRQDNAEKFKIPSPPVKYCVTCGRKKSNQMKKRHHRSHSRNPTRASCKRHTFIHTET